MAYVFRFSVLLLIVTAATAPADAPARQHPDIPPALTHYKGRRIAHTMHWLGADWLTRTERDREEGVALLESELKKKLRPGMTACDLGCGNGFWTLRLSTMVGEKGKVYGVDIQKEMLYGPLKDTEPLMERAKNAGIENIIPVHNTLISTGLPPGSCDLILLVDVYHEFSHPEHMLKSMRESLKPEGYIVLVEYRAEDRTVPIKEDHKMSKAQILKEYEPNGFVLVEEFDELPWQHVMYFKRSDAPAD
jgi:ubiquinone/menaquinone biosynthesis C-methylase UbiE